jgi:RNA polymerase sigma-54 factor
MVKLSLQLKLGQQLTMTPQLQQAIRLLQMPVLELNTQLQEALETNVMLEQLDPVESLQTEIEQPNEQSAVVAGNESEQTEWNDIYGSGRNNESWSGGEQPQIDIPDTSEETLRDHLLWQLEIEHFNPREAAIGEAIIDYINDDGYLTVSLENILGLLARDAKFSLDEIAAALKHVQALDPAGVGGRNLSECICPDNSEK